VVDVKLIAREGVTSSAPQNCSVAIAEMVTVVGDTGLGLVEQKSYHGSPEIAVDNCQHNL